MVDQEEWPDEVRSWPSLKFVDLLLLHRLHLLLHLLNLLIRGLMSIHDISVLNVAKTLIHSIWFMSHKGQLLQVILKQHKNVQVFF